MQNEIPGHAAMGQFIVFDQTVLQRPAKPTFTFEVSHRLNKFGGVLDPAEAVLWQPNPFPSDYDVAGRYGDLKITPEGQWVYELHDDDPIVDKLEDGEWVVEVFFIRMTGDNALWLEKRELHILVQGVTDAVREDSSPADDDATGQTGRPPLPQRGDFDIVAVGDHSDHSRPVIVVGTRQKDAPTTTAPAGSIVTLKMGGHLFGAEEVRLNDGVDQVIYMLAQGARFGSWQPAGGHQRVENFDIGVDKLWFISAPNLPWESTIEALQTLALEGRITYETFDSDADNNPETTADDAVRAAHISASAHPLLHFVLHRLTLQFGHLDDQRAAFEILNSKANPYEAGSLGAFSEILGDSLGYIEGWDDIPTSLALPGADVLPAII